MKYISLCSGIEAATHAVEPLGWKPVCFSEIDDACSKFLKHKYKAVRNVGNMLKHDWTRERANVLIAGTPCPSFSKMGVWTSHKNAGADPRGKLAHKFLDIAMQTHSEWFIWENVSDVLSAKGGRFFRSWLKKASEYGYVCGWRVLDTHKDFGLPVLRKRMFVVGHRGPASRVEEVLLRPRNARGRSLPFAAEERRIRSANADFAEGSVVAFDAASLKPIARSTALPTLLRGHAGRVGLVIDPRGQGFEVDWHARKSGIIRKLTAAEGEAAMGFTRGYTNAVALSEQQRLEMIGNSFSPVIINALAEGISGRG